MLIGIDGLALQGKPTGIGRYIAELCKVLDKQLPEARFIIFSQEPISEIQSLSNRWTFIVEPTHWGRGMRAVVWLKYRLGWLAGKKKLDIFWATSTLLPYFYKKIPTISTVYDLNYKIVPNTMRLGMLWAHRLYFSSDIKKANRVLAISKGTSERMYDLLGRRADAVVPPAVSHLFKRPAETVTKKILKKLNIKKPYFVSVGTLEPRKNIALLVREFINLRNEGHLRGYTLVLVGQFGWSNAEIKDLIEKNQNYIKVLGYVADEELPGIYAGSEAFIFPSIYEGYGIPVLEARMCGAKILASDIPEIREAGEKSGIYIKPDSSGIRNGLLSILDSGVKKSSPTHSWEKSGEKLVEEMKSLVKKYA